MSQSNNIHIEGNLCGEPELRFTTQGTAVCNVRVAQTDSYMRNGERHESTEYVQVVIWDQLGENVAMSLKKGNRVVIDGKLRQRQVELEGVKRYFTEVHADNVSVSLRWAVIDGDIERATKTVEKAPAMAGALETEEEPF